MPLSLASVLTGVRVQARMGVHERFACEASRGEGYSGTLYLMQPQTSACFRFHFFVQQPATSVTAKKQQKTVSDGAGDIVVMSASGIMS